MLPYLREGDRVWLKKVHWDQISLGDLVAFEQNHIVFTHRVIRKSPDQLWTKGDNNFFPDLPIRPQEVLGKIVAIERDGKTMVLEKEHTYLNLVLGYSHAGIGLLGRSFFIVLRMTHGKLRQPLYWMGRGFLFPLKILERILVYAI